MSEIEGANATKVGQLSLEIVGLLVNESSETRKRAISAALLILGEDQGASSIAPTSQHFDVVDHGSSLNGRATTWMKQNNLSAEQLDRAFHLSNGVAEFIGSVVPGQSAREKTCNAYVLLGIGQLLVNGNPAFDDKTAREFCTMLGFYDRPNHTASLAKGKGNSLIGSKEKGWTVTTPGLTLGASLIRELSK